MEWDKSTKEELNLVFLAQEIYKPILFKIKGCWITRNKSTASLGNTPEFEANIRPWTLVAMRARNLFENINPQLMQSKFSNVFTKSKGNSCTSVKHCPEAFPGRMKTGSLCLTVHAWCRQNAFNVHFSRLRLAHSARVARPSGNNNTRQQCPSILPHQDIHLIHARTSSLSSQELMWEINMLNT